MKSIQKNCWVKVTNFKLFGKDIWSITEECDNSDFEVPENTSFYTVPSVFNKVGSNANNRN